MDRPERHRAEHLGAQPPAEGTEPTSDIENELEQELTAWGRPRDDEGRVVRHAVLMTPDAIIVVGIVLCCGAIVLARWAAF